MDNNTYYAQKLLGRQSIITISGNPGSGKSTVAKLLANYLNAERVYAGGLMRQKAEEMKITLEELTARARSDLSIDKDLDFQVGQIARSYISSGRSVIIEGRPQFYFFPESSKLYIHVDPQVGAMRIWNDLQKKDVSKSRNQKNFEIFDDLYLETIQREAEDAERYKNLYGVDHRVRENYDFVEDSTDKLPEVVVHNIFNFLLNNKN